MKVGKLLTVLGAMLFVLAPFSACGGEDAPPACQTHSYQLIAQKSDFGSEQEKLFSTSKKNALFAAWNDRKSHCRLCSVCGDYRLILHNFTPTQVNEDTHVAVCDDCEYVTTEQHDYSVAGEPNLVGLNCNLCNHEETDNLFMPLSAAESGCRLTFNPRAVTAGVTQVLVPDVFDGVKVTSFSNAILQSDFCPQKLIISDGVAVEENAFVGAEPLKEVVFLGASNVGRDAFKGSGVQTVKVSAGVNLASGAFSSCAALQSVQLTGDTFVPFPVDDCPAFLGVRFQGGLYQGSTLISHDVEDQKLVLPAGVTAIAAGAFSAATQLKYVFIPRGVTSIEDGAFLSCDSGLRLYFEGYAPAGEGWKVVGQGKATVEENVTLTADGFLLSSRQTLTSGLKIAGYLGDSAALEIPSVLGERTVTEIYARAFENRLDIQSVTIPATVVSVGESAFLGCENLQNVTLEEGVQMLEKKAFFGCTALESIVLPSTLYNLGVGAFFGCTALESVQVAGESDWLKGHILSGGNMEILPVGTLSAEELAQALKTDDEYIWVNQSAVE